MSAAVRTVDERGGAWLRIVLNRPPANLLSLDMVRAIAETVDRAVAPGRKWITFEGAGGDFSFGAVIQEHLPGAMEAVLPATHALLRQLLALPVATAALVQGRCLGGGFELALACDTIIAAEDATCGLPEIQICAFAPAAAALLPLRVGAGRAAEMVIVGAARGAPEWQSAGLVQALAPSGMLLDTAARWFDAHLAPRSAVGLGAAAQASRLAIRAMAEPVLAAAERLYIERVLPTEDAVEGVRAFVEKRAPRWANR